MELKQLERLQSELDKSLAAILSEQISEMDVPAEAEVQVETDAVGSAKEIKRLDISNLFGDGKSSYKKYI